MTLYPERGIKVGVYSGTNGVISKIREKHGVEEMAEQSTDAMMESLMNWLSDPIVVLILSFIATGFVIRKVSAFLESRKK